MNCAAAKIALTPVTKRLEAEVKRLATTPRTTISLVGEAGSGKQAWARRLHAESSRSGSAFVVLQPGEVLADAVIEAAHGGSLYIREAARLGPGDQERLMVLLGRGAADDPRVLAGTRRPLEDAVIAGTLREDLEYRLNVLALEVPPLRERLGELGALAVHLIGQLAPRLGVAAVGLESSAEALLAHHDWPGNLHELSWTLEGALLGRLQSGATGPIRPDEVSITPKYGAENVQSIAQSTSAVGAGSVSLDALEESAVKRALEQNGGNRSLAARQLGIHRTTLYHKMRRFGLR